MIDSGYAVGVIAAMGAVTFALRALPFIAAPWLQKYPIVQGLGRFLPLAIMVLLLVHSARGAASTHASGPWPELLAVSLVMAVQWRSRNALLSMVVGTGAYVLQRNLM